MLQTALHYSHQLLQEVIHQGDTVIDATVGNGHDTLFLASLVGKTGKVYGFDVQQQALDTTQHKLFEAEADKQVSLHLQGHETLSSVLEDDETIQGAIFNLGYLPKSDKSIITQASTTIQALHAMLARLEKGGRILLVIYYGHDGGLDEKEQVLSFVQTIDQETFNVLLYQFINQKNNPPILIAIERKANG